MFALHTLLSRLQRGLFWGIPVQFLLSTCMWCFIGACALAAQLEVGGKPILV